MHSRLHWLPGRNTSERSIGAHMAETTLRQRRQTDRWRRVADFVSGILAGWFALFTLLLLMGGQ